MAEKATPTGNKKFCRTVGLIVLLINIHFRLTFVHSTVIAKSFARTIFLAPSHAYGRLIFVPIFVFEVVVNSGMSHPSARSISLTPSLAHCNFSASLNIALIIFI